VRDSCRGLRAQGKESQKKPLECQRHKFADLLDCICSSGPITVVGRGDSYEKEMILRLQLSFSYSHVSTRG
jgi:hypothetical protein